MIVDNKSKAEALLDKLESASLVSIDCETISLSDKTLVAFSVSYDMDNTRYTIPVAMKYIKNLPKSLWLKILKSACLRTNPDPVYHNFVFDGEVLYPYIPEIKDNPVHDTMVMSQLLNEHGSHGLKQLVKKHLDYDMLTFKEVCGTGKRKLSFSELQDEETIDKYAGDDALMTKKLFMKLYYIMNRKENYDILHTAYYKIEKPLLNVVLDMHIQGVPVDKERVQQVADFCKEKCVKFNNLIQNKMTDVNVNSPKQLREWFVDKQGMPVLKRSFKTNNPSVDSEVLHKYAKTCEEAQWILDYRKYNKILSTFIPALTPSYGNRIYPTFRQVGTTSGRFSSAHINFQNIPKADEDELDLRACIKAGDGRVLVGADYSQCELRLAAHYSNDKAAIKAYNDGIDMHKITVEATGLERRKAKVVNFGMLYGMSAKTLAKNIDEPVDSAAKFMDKFFNTYPGMLQMRNQVRKELFNVGYIELFGGRRRRLSGSFKDKEDWKQEGELRSITNALIQGSGAMIIKRAMVLMQEELKKFDAHIIAQVHDELIVECPEENAEVVQKIVESYMIEPTKDMKVPFTVDSKIGKSWKEIH